MKHRNLHEMITYIQRGTNLHIGVCFFGNYGNEFCTLPHRHQIHSSQICESFKNQSKYGYKRCFACRNLALKKALTSKTPFGGHCINGVYEYTHPVTAGNDVACVIFIGNVVDEEGYSKITSKIGESAHLISTMENSYTPDDLIAVAELIEGYIRMLLEKHSHDNSPINPLNENIKNYINSNLEFDIDITQISEIFHYNKTYLGRMFKKENNMSIAEYTNMQRIEAAKEMLTGSNSSVITISNKVGFNNVTYFNRVFRKATDMSPLQYRNANKN